MPTIKKEDLLLFIMEKEYVRMYELKEEFVDKNRIAERTLYDWRKDLINENKLKFKINEDGNKIYYVPKYQQQELEDYKLRSKFYEALRKDPEFVLDQVKDMKRDFAEYREFLIKQGFTPVKNGGILDFSFVIEDEEKAKKIIEDLERREKEYNTKKQKSNDTLKRAK